MSKPAFLTLLFILAIGIFLRLYPSVEIHGVGYDENLYRNYINILDAKGVLSYPQISKGYIDAQKELPAAILPPTRFLYIYSGYLWHHVFGSEPLLALKRVSAAFTIFTLLLSTVFAARLGGTQFALGVAALMACAPTQLHMSQHALIDGVFAFWALLTIWALWENLRHPDKLGWLALLAVALVGLVLTKENAAFVYAALAVIMAANHWLHFGKVTPKLIATLVGGPAVALGFLFILAGGPAQFIEIYRLLVEKANVLPYAIQFCDGPWYRYLVDLLLISPLVLLLAVGEVFQLKPYKAGAWYLFAFIAGSYLFMANVKYSFNLRYANMWDMPLRFLAFAQLLTLSNFFRRYRVQGLIGLTLLLCLFELNQFRIFFVNYRLYELVTEGLLRAVKIVK